MRAVRWVREHKVPLVKTLAVLSGFLALGMSQGIRGPTLIDLGMQVNSPVSRIAFIMTARAVGHLLGSVSSESLLIPVLILILQPDYS